MVLVDVQTEPPAVAHVGSALSIVVSLEVGSSGVIRIESATSDDALVIRRDHLGRLTSPWFRTMLESWVAVQLAHLLQDLKVRAAALRTPLG